MIRFLNSYKQTIPCIHIIPVESNVIKVSDWNPDDKILELSTEKNIEKKAWNTFETKKDYCKMLLIFHTVDFGKGVSQAR